MKTVNSKQTLNSRIFENQLLLYVPKEPQNDPKIVEKKLFGSSTNEGIFLYKLPKFRSIRKLCIFE